MNRFFKTIRFIIKITGYTFAISLGLLLSVNTINAQVTLSQSLLLNAEKDSVFNDTIKATGFNNIAEFGIEIDWDSTKLQYVSTYAWNAKITSLGSPLENTPNGGSWIAAWVISGSKAATIGNATICIIQFKFTGQTCASLKWNSGNSGMTDNNFNSIPLIFKNNSICPMPPVITEQPAEETVCENNTSSFKVSASSFIPTTFKWLVSKNGGTSYSAISKSTQYPNVTDSVLTISLVTSAMNNYYYKCVASNCGGSVTSSAAVLKVNNPPVVNVSPVGPITQYKPVTLTGSTPDTVSYQWQYIDKLSNHINIDGDTNAVLNVSVTGNYRLVVTDRRTACVSTSATVQVNMISLIIDSINASSSAICAGTSSTLTVFAESKTPIIKYLWSTGDTTQSIVVSPTDTTIYKVTVTSDSINIKDSIEVNVTSITATAVAQGATTFCTGDSVLLNAKCLILNAKYQWQNSGVNINGATTSFYTAKLSGIYEVIVTQNICAATSSPITVTVYPYPAVTTAPEGSTSLCMGDSVKIIAGTGLGFSYQWQNSGLNINGATTSFLYAKSSGSYSVIVTQYSCPGTSSPVTVNVYPYPLASAIAQGVTTFCTGDSVTITANTGTGITYQWQNSGINIDGATLSSYTAKTSGIYEVIVTQNICPTTSSPVTVTVYPYPSVTAAPEGSTSLCIGDSVKLIAGTGIGFKYQWLNSGSKITGATASYFTAKSEGNYSVVVTQYSCPGTSSSVTVTVNNCRNIYGICYVDKNSNCIYDSNETTLPNVKIMLLKNDTLADVMYTDVNGRYYFNEPYQGNYIIKTDSVLTVGEIISCGNSTIPVKTSPSVINISYNCNSSIKNEINANMNGVGFTPGSIADVFLNFMNTSCNTFNITEKIVCTSNNCIIDSASNNGIIEGDTANFTTMLCNQNIMFSNFIRANVSNNAKGNDTVCFYAIFTPSNNPTRQGSTIIKKCFTVKDLWNSNEKEVSPVASDQTGIYPDSTLNYTINFQNTGVSNALNISITDTLDNNLDISTLKVVSSNYPVSISMLSQAPNYVVKFTFTNINLTYESANEISSHGYVTYSIKPEKGLNPGTIINNTANIYFDLNPAISTNTLKNSIINTQSTVNIASVKSPSSAIEIYPNPVSSILNIKYQISNTEQLNVTITDMTGNTVFITQCSALSVHKKINISNLIPGLYILRIQTSDKTIEKYSKIIKL